MTSALPEPIGYYADGLPRPFAGQRSGSIAFGVILIVLGGMSGCMGLMSPLVLLAPRQPDAPHIAGMMFSGALLYLAGGGALIWLGIGAVRLRRWARPLLLATGAPALLLGVETLFVTPLLARGIKRGMDAAATATPPPTWLFPAMMVGAIIFVFVLLVAFPAAIVWFYRLPKVQQMLEIYDPTPRWTDGRAIPLLIMWVVTVYYTIAAVVSIPNPVAPVCGTYVMRSGAPVAKLAEAVIGGVLCWLVLRRPKAGWWGSLTLLVVIMTVNGITLRHPMQLDVYRDAGYSEKQIGAIKNSTVDNGGFMKALAIINGIFALSFLVYSRRYFITPPGAEATQDKPSADAP